MSKNKFTGKIPETIYVVSSPSDWRIFSSEGQARRCFEQNMKDGLASKITSYNKDSVIAKGGADV